MAGQGLRDKGKAWLPATPLVSVLDPGGNKSCFLQPSRASGTNPPPEPAASTWKMASSSLGQFPKLRTATTHSQQGSPQRFFSDRQASQALIQELGGLQEKSGFDLPP